MVTSSPSHSACDIVLCRCRFRAGQSRSSNAGRLTQPNLKVKAISNGPLLEMLLEYPAIGINSTVHTMAMTASLITPDTPATSSRHRALPGSRRTVQPRRLSLGGLTLLLRHRIGSGLWPDGRFRR